MPLQRDAVGELPTFDEALMLSQLSGDRELARIILTSAIGDMPRYFDILDAAVADSDWKSAERATHNLKSLAAQIGAVRLATMVKAENARLKAGNEFGPNRAAALRQQFQALTAALRHWVE